MRRATAEGAAEFHGLPPFSYASPSALISTSMILMPTNGAARPPSPYTRRLRRSRACALEARHRTPRKRQWHQRDDDDRVEDHRRQDGRLRRLQAHHVHGAQHWNALRNIAGTMQSTSPRHWRSRRWSARHASSATACRCRRSRSVWSGWNRDSTMLPASFAAWVPVFIARPTSGLGQCRRVIRAVAGHGGTSLPSACSRLMSAILSSGVASARSRPPRPRQRWRQP